MRHAPPTWSLSAASAPALLLACLGALAVGGSVAWAQGYWSSRHVLALDALRVELDRDMLVALAAVVVCAGPALWLRRRGWTGRAVPLAVMLLTLAPVALSVCYAAEWRLSDVTFDLLARTRWQDTPLPRALRHVALMGGVLAAAAVSAAALVYAGRPRAGAQRAVGRRRGHRAAPVVALACLGAWGAVHLIAAGFGPVPAKAPRHVILLTWDSTRADHVSCYGHPAGTTPSVDALAADAVLFEHAYSQNNWTRPSYASILTSRQMYQIQERGRLRPEIATVAELLKERGYHTLSVVQNPNLDARWGFDQGFDEYHHVEIDGTPERVNAVAIPRLRALAQSGQPVFAFIHYQEPHWPYRDATVAGAPIAPADAHRLMTDNHFEKGEPDNVEDIARFLDECYQHDIRDADSALGRLLAALQDMGLYDESLVIFVSDHGDEFHEHGAFGHGHDNLHPELTRVPLLIRFPRSMGVAPRRIPDTVRNVDLVPTILDVVGIEPPADLEGTTLLPLDRLAGEARVATSHLGPIRMLRRGRYAALIDPRQPDPATYYDLMADPGELHAIPRVAVGEVAAVLDAHAKAWFASYAAVVGAVDAGADDGSVIEHQHQMDADLRDQLRSLGYAK